MKEKLISVVPEMLKSSGGDCWSVTGDEKGIYTLSLHSGKKQNVLSAEALNGLCDIFAWLESGYETGEVSGAIITSENKNSFCAGANIRELVDMLGDRDSARVWAERYWEELLSHIYYAKFPVVAAISGVCLGGGLEVALLCHARVAVNSRRTILGLPETQLGIIPGFGGTQLLPETVGLRRALKMILSGKHINAKKAFEYGLVDSLVQPLKLHSEAKWFVHALKEETLRKEKKRTLPWANHSLITGLVTKYVCKKAREKVVEETNGVYPAPLWAVDAIEASTKPLEDGILVEREKFTDCIESAEAKNLISLFLLKQDVRSRYVAGDDVKTPRRIGIVGAGTMGRDIAYICLRRGMEVVLYDVSRPAIDNALDVVGEKLSSQNREAFLENLSVAYGEFLGVFSDLDLVIEAIVEDEHVKREVFEKLEAIVSNDTIIATNTSSLSMSSMADVFERSSRYCALHFFNPVDQMDLVEVVRHRKTSSKTLEKACAFVSAVKKVPIVLEKDCPGFVVNRILYHYIVPSIKLMTSYGVLPKEIDVAFERMGMVMGPCTMLDLVGFDVGYHVLESMEREYGVLYDGFSNFKQIVEEGEILGKKTTKGFYFWKNGEKVGENTPFLKRIGVEKPEFGERPVSLYDPAKLITQRVYKEMRKEAQKIVNEGICERDILDLAVVLGAGITPNRRGLLFCSEE